MVGALNLLYCVCFVVGTEYSCSAFSFPLAVTILFLINSSNLDCTTCCFVIVSLVTSIRLYKTYGRGFVLSMTDSRRAFGIYHPNVAAHPESVRSSAAETLYDGCFFSDDHLLSRYLLLAHLFLNFIVRVFLPL